MERLALIKKIVPFGQGLGTFSEISGLHFEGLAFSYLLGVGCGPPGAGCGSELRRASRAGAQNIIRDAGALRAPAPTKDFFDFCIDFLCAGSQFLVMFLQTFMILGSEFSYSAFSYRVSEVYH